MKYLIIFGEEEWGSPFDLQIIEVPTHRTPWDIINDLGFNEFEVSEIIPLYKFKKRFEKRLKELNK